MTFDGDHLLRVPGSVGIRDLLASVAATHPATPHLERTYTAAQLAVAVESVQTRAGHLLERAQLFRVGEADGHGPEGVEGADGETYVVDADFRYAPVVRRLEDTDCYHCYSANAVEVYRDSALCRDCSYEERASWGDLVTVYEPCRTGDHADCIGADQEEETRPLDLARRCECVCHANGEADS